MTSKSDIVAGIINDIRRMFQVLTEQSKKVELETGLTGSQLWVITILEDESPLKVSELARRMYLHPATMVGLLDRLEAKGMIQRTRSDKDRRVVHINLTPQGGEVVKNSPEVLQNNLVKGFTALDTNILQTISAGLAETIKVFGAQKVQPKPIMCPETSTPEELK